jgi:lipoprotein-anchoring transpeptidase ErfK/SrfK
MALPSQTERSSEMNRAVMGQKGESGSRILLIVFGLVILAGGIFLVSKGWKKQGETTLAGTSPAGTSPVGTTPAPTTPTTPTTVVREPGTASAAPASVPTPAPNTPGAQPALPDSVPPVASQITPGTPAPSGALAPTPIADGAAPQPGNQAAGQPTTSPLSSQGFAQLVEAGDRAIAANKLVEARLILSKALLLKDAPSEQKPAIRSKLQKINEDLVFSPRIEAGDTLVESYKIQRGDALARLPRKRELATDWRLIQRINRITNPGAIREGQTIKLVKGPFHAVVTKSEYRVDVYAGSPSEPATWLFIKSYTAGLGEGNSTPVGNYTIKRNSKLENPAWVNPRTGEKFAANDPKNPIGEFWLGWRGEGDSAQNTGYGFHGTIDPQSIGKQMSMGCVRLADADIAELFSLLVEDVSVVRVLP